MTPRQRLGWLCTMVGLLVAPGCDRVLERVGLTEAAPSAPSAPPEPSEDARALAIAFGAMVPEAGATAITPAPPVAPPIVREPELAELELWDVAVEWTPSAGAYGHYYGGGDPPDTLSLSAKARTHRAVSSKAELVVKATCDDGPDLLTDADQARINDVPGGALPTEGTEFRVNAQLFVKNIVPVPSACRVVVSLRDKTATPVVRGSTSLCWKPGSKTPSPCPRPANEVPLAWSVREVQILPTVELGFAVMAGTAAPPDRLGVRSTCHVGDKHFVEFQYLDARLHALEPGDVQRHHLQLTSAWEYMRTAQCDVEIQAVNFDVESNKLLGVTEIGRRCFRPAGVREGRCSTAAIELAPIDAGGTPVEATIQNANFSAYNGWFSGYSMAELTLRAPLSKDARVEFVAVCGKRTERAAVAFATPLELVYPGQSLRAQGGVNGRGRPKLQSCTTEFVLHTKDEVGLEREWPLGKQCYSSDGTGVPCAGAPPSPGSGGLGAVGVGIGSAHSYGLSKRYRRSKPVLR